MIAQLEGRLIALDGTEAVVQVGGIGLSVLCPPQTVAGLEIGDQVTWFTSLIVREDSLSLFGFSTANERVCFDLVQSASGIGPKTALAVVAVLGPTGLAQAIRREDLAALTRVPGIGQKGAQKMVIELKEKVTVLGVETDSGSLKWREQVVSGLQGLGWSVKDAEAAAEAVAPMVEEDPEISVAALMRAALRRLARA